MGTRKATSSASLPRRPASTSQRSKRSSRSTVRETAGFAADSKVTPRRQPLRFWRFRSSNRLMMSALTERRLHCIEQRAHAEGDVLDPSVDEKRRRGADAAFPAALDVLADALQIDLVVHLDVIARHIELQPFRIAAKL